MSAYQTQRCLFDHLRACEHRTTSEPPPVDVEGYELTPDERDALVDGDVAALFDLGVHPVLINGFCRANGWKRADYRVLFRDDQREEATAKAVRWLRS